MNKQTRDYLTKRQVDLLTDQKHFEAMREENRTDDESLLYSPETIEVMITETRARRTELALMMTSLQIDDEHQEMTKRERAQDRLSDNERERKYEDEREAHPLAGEHDPR